MRCLWSPIFSGACDQLPVYCHMTLITYLSTCVIMCVLSPYCVLTGIHDGWLGASEGDSGECGR